MDLWKWKAEALPEINPQECLLPETLQASVQKLSEEWEASGKMQRLWDGDESIWTSSGEAKWLGWLRVVRHQRAEGSRSLRDFAAQVRGRYSHAVLLGMGGSSLCPEVLRCSFGTREGFPDLRVLDSTDPAQIQACENSVRLQTTLFLAASKSGSTLETSLLTRYFLERLSDRVGAARAAAHFVAITDPGSQLEASAKELGFGHVLYGVPSIGGRYSALSHFGMAPAAAMGLDVDRLLRGAEAMQAACSPIAQSDANPGLQLGLVLGAAAREGRDKLTLIAAAGVSPLGAWIEQLVAESTGKDGTGIVPVDGEPLSASSSYGGDRVFVHLHLNSERDAARDAALAELHGRGHPVIRITIPGVEEIGQEFFRWELATAVASSVLGINPFDQPDVEASKVAARRLTALYEAEGSLPAEEAFFEDDGILLFASRDHAARLTDTAAEATLAALLRSHLGTSGEGDYIALLAYLQKAPPIEASLDRIRRTIRVSMPVATCLGFGPRFLHSTGQLHKGGASNGVFLQIGCDDTRDLRVPGLSLSFGVVKAAQARGDFDVLQRLRRRALRIHVHGDLAEALDRLESAFGTVTQ